jgi:hypothetical protein
MLSNKTNKKISLLKGKLMTEEWYDEKEQKLYLCTWIMMQLTRVVIG